MIVEKLLFTDRHADAFISLLAAIARQAIDNMV